jgi:hypothetical protein
LLWIAKSKLAELNMLCLFDPLTKSWPMSGGRHAAPNFREGGRAADKPAIPTPHMHARERFVRRQSWPQRCLIRPRRIHPNKRIEPPRVSRRLFGLSYAAIGMASCIA